MFQCKTQPSAVIPFRHSCFGITGRVGADRVRTKRRYAEEGLDEVLRHHNQVNRPRKVDERVEAHLIALACSPVPDGHDHWTMRALAGKVVELGLVESLSPETVRLRRSSLGAADLFRSTRMEGAAFL